MSLLKISKEQVADAMAALRRDGKPLSLPAIRAVVGNKGSLGTIQELKKQLEDEERVAKEPPHAVEAFRTIWAEAVQRGRAERDAEITDLQEVIKSLSMEARVFEGEAIAAQTNATEAVGKYDEAMVKLNRVNEALAKAGRDAEDHATKYLKVVDEHLAELTKTRNLLTAEQARAHELELKLTRAETKLELTAATSPRGRRLAAPTAKAPSTLRSGIQPVPNQKSG